MPAMHTTSLQRAAAFLALVVSLLAALLYSRMETRRFSLGVQVEGVLSPPHLSFSPPHLQATIVPTPACKRILLIVIFNTEFYSNVPYLRSLYGRTFRDIAFYGPVANAGMGVRLNADRYKGYMQQQTLVQAYRDYPGHDGYLWSGDDILFNPWHLLASPGAPSLDKAWLLEKPSAQSNMIVSMDSSPTDWRWQQPFATSSAKIVRLGSVLRAHMPSLLQKRQIAKLGGATLIGAGADFGYIPKRLMPSFAGMAGLPVVGDLMHEIFIPTFGRLLSDQPDDYTELKGVYLWYPAHRAGWDQWFHCTETDFLHPVKFSSTRNRELLRAISKTANCSWELPVAGLMC